jgi:hypothetical protein
MRWALCVLLTAFPVCCTRGEPGRVGVHDLTAEGDVLHG